MPNIICKSQQLKQQCQLPVKSLAKLREIVRQHLQKEPDNSIGLSSPWQGQNSTVKQGFRTWTNTLLGSGIAERFWGLGTFSKWNLDEHGDEIAEFFTQLVINQASTELRRRRRGCKKAEESEDEEYEIPPGMIQYHSSALPVSTRSSSSQQKKPHENPEPINNNSNNIDPPASSLPPHLSPKKHTHEDEARTSSPPKRIRLTSFLDGLEGSDSETSSSERSPSNTPDPYQDDRVFITRICPENAMNHVFAPLTVSFQSFFEYFREAWGTESDVVNVEETKVKVFVSGLGEFRVGFGRSRERGWSCVMKRVVDMPESEIMIEFWNE